MVLHTRTPVQSNRIPKLALPEKVSNVSQMILLQVPCRAQTKSINIQYEREIDGLKRTIHVARRLVIPP